MYARIKAAGRLKSDYNTVTDSTEFELTGEIMTGVELPLPKVLLDYLIKDIKAATFDAPVAIYNCALTINPLSGSSSVMKRIWRK
jgi:hypothetical protein